MKRRPRPELLDTDSGKPAEIYASLLDLRWFNRCFGGLSTVQSLISTVAGHIRKTKFSLLEVASGEGYIPQRVSQELKRKNLALDLVLLDRRVSHFALKPSLRKVAGDARSLPFRDGSFDLVCSSLFLHHLSPDEAVLFLTEALRVSSLAVLVHDLVRHPLHLALAYMGTPLYRSRLTRNDAPASIWQAYTAEELRRFLDRAGAGAVEIQERYLYRMGAIAWK